MSAELTIFENGRGDWIVDAPAIVGGSRFAVAVAPTRDEAIKAAVALARRHGWRFYPPIGGEGAAE